LRRAADAEQPIARLICVSTTVAIAAFAFAPLAHAGMKVK